MIRMFQESDYPMVQQWWVEHGWTPVPFGMLPKLGVIWGADGDDLAAGWLYMDNSVGVCMLEWVVSNPVAPGAGVVRAISHIVKFLSAEAIRLNYSVMLTTCRQESLARLYERQGFKKTDSEMIHLVKGLTKEDDDGGSI